MASDDTALDLDLLAASLRADSTDVGTFVEGLAGKLEDAMPGHVRVERRRAGMLGSKQVRRIQLDAGDRRLELRSDGARIETRSATVSGGIVLKSDELDTEEWLKQLGGALADEARRSQSTRQALERLLTQ
jgi:hypothetical protein